MVYLPAEDSYLLRTWVEEFAKGTVLDIGTGTGIQAIAASKNAAKVIAVDLNPNALEYAKHQAEVMDITNIEFRQSDLFSAVKPSEKFDMIVFNPPYLPEHPYDKEIDTTGGKHGYETIFLFLEQAKNHLKPLGKILMIFSSFSKPEKILEKARSLGYKFSLLQKKHISFEDLFVYEFSGGV